MAGSHARQVLLDTDISLGTPGAEIDDGAALISLIRAEGEAVGDAPELKAITTVHGNVGPEFAAHNLQRLLSSLKRTGLPLGLGSAQPLVGDKRWFDGWQKGYGRTPRWPGAEELPAAAELIVQTIERHAGLSILAIGPLTNLAHALRIDPTIVSKVGALFVMGGSFGFARGSAAISAPAEFNIRCDPEAAQIVLNAGWRVSMLGLELTRQIVFSREDFTALPQSDAALGLLRAQAPGWIERVENEGWEQDGCALHDAVAVAAFLDDSLFDWREMAVVFELEEPDARGEIRVAPAGASGSFVRVATRCRVQACKERIWSLLAGE